MILIADSGSTKCDWILLDSDYCEIARIHTKGLNPILLNVNQISDILFQNRSLVNVYNKVIKVVFYGAGCGGDRARHMLLKVLEEFFTNAKVHVAEDLMAAVHATTTSSGVVCILGTGSNCCYYDGSKIHINQASLGYMVMDEGSGNYFGKKLLNRYFYNKMPPQLKNKFEDAFDVSLEEVLKNLYNTKNPSAYLAKFTPFLIENKSEPFFYEIVYNGIRELFDNLINCYQEELKENPLHFVGSVGYYLQEEISQIGKERGLRISSFVKRPMDSIIRCLEQLPSKLK